MHDCLELPVNSTFIQVGNEILQKTLSEIYGKAFLDYIVKLKEFTTKALDAIIKAISGKLNAITELIDEYIMEPISEFNKMISQGVTYFMSIVSTIYNDIPLPIPSFLLFGVILPANKMYLELSDEAKKLYESFNPTSVIQYIIMAVGTPINWILSKVESIVETVMVFVNMRVDKMKNALIKLTTQLAGLLVPAVDLINNIIDPIILLFNKGMSIKNDILSYIMKFPNITMDDIPDDLKPIIKLFKCMLSAITGFITLTLTLT